MIDSNVKGLMYVTKAVIPFMLKNKSGHIINVGSIAGKEVYPKGSVYCSSKFAVDAFTQGLRIDLLKYGIKVSAINPGLVETEFSFSTVDNKKDKNIEVSIERTIENGEDLTNVVIKGEGDVTRIELEEELDRMLEKQGIDKEKTKLNIEMEIKS